MNHYGYWITIKLADLPTVVAVLFVIGTYIQLAYNHYKSGKVI